MKEAKDFDIKYPQPVITSIDPTTAKAGSTIVVNGENLIDSMGFVVKLGTTNITSKIIKSTHTATSFSMVMPRICDADYIYITNSYKVTVSSKDKFTPIYDSTYITSIPDTLCTAANFVIKGKNVDFITSINFGDSVYTVVGSSQTPTILTVTSDDLKKKVSTTKPSKIIISFKCRNGNDLPIKGGIVVIASYPLPVLLASDPDTSVTITKGDPIKLIVNDAAVAQKYLAKITIGGADTTFTCSSPYINTFMPKRAKLSAKAKKVDITFTGIYGNAVTYKTWYRFQ